MLASVSYCLRCGLTASLLKGACMPLGSCSYAAYKYRIGKCNVGHRIVVEVISSLLSSVIVLVGCAICRA
jgi:hypothetical protein